MRGLKYGLRQCMGWAAAAAAAFLVCNALVFFYHHPAGWIERDSSATDAIWKPGSTLRMGTEGCGVYTVDQRGYLNPEFPLADTYTLAVGSSFVQGKEVPLGSRFTDLLNAALTDSADELAVYNVSQDGFYFPDIVTCFPALLQEFPGAKSIVIEISSTDFSAAELTQALEQKAFDPAQTGGNIWGQLTLSQKLTLWVKEAFPALSLAKSQMAAISAKETGTASDSSELPAEEDIAPVLETVLKTLRGEFDGQLIILYHPGVQIESDGTMTILREESSQVFAEACRENDILFVDVSGDFLRAYEEDFSVPYGHQDGTMGSGHFNEDGHRIVAEALLPVLEGGDPA